MVQEFLTQSNPFEERDMLYTVVSKVMTTQEIKDFVQRASIIGENQYKKFLSEVIEFKRKNIHDVIKKNNLAIFNFNLYASLSVACQTRESNLSDFFSDENYS